ncbi:MAG: (Fe-S)-binding protein [Candidatus Hydrothermarchaeaceae archaeon]
MTKVTEAKVLSPLEVHRHLPRTNCGECGTNCMGFAVKLLNRKAALHDCPQLKKAEYLHESMLLKDILAPVLKIKETSLVIHENACNGCGNCVIVCPPNIACSMEATGGKGPSSKDVVLKMRNGVVIEVNLHSCKRFEEEEEGSSPCRLCIDSCPFEAIEFV